MVHWEAARFCTRAWVGVCTHLPSGAAAPQLLLEADTCNSHALPTHTQGLLGCLAMEKTGNIPVFVGTQDIQRHRWPHSYCPPRTGAEGEQAEEKP